MKAHKLKARLPRGFVDRNAADLAATQAMMGKIRAVYELYGFEGLETPFVEYTDALGKFLPDQDRPNEGVFSFQDDDEQWLSLRYDLTAPLARYVAEHFDALPKPYRSYRAGYVFRNEKPGPGRFRQFMQFDADTVGAPSVAADAEICMMAADTLEALGIARGDYVIKANNRKVLDGVMEAIGLAGEESAGRRLIVLRAIDKLDKFPASEVAKLLGPGRKDESGDFTKGAGLDEAAINRVLDVAQFSVPHFRAAPEYQASSDELIVSRDNYDDISGVAVVSNLATIERMRVILADSPLALEGLAELETIARLVAAAGYGPKRIRIDPSVVRGLEYYTGPVFEAELLIEAKDEAGRPVRFGSVGGGGRYDGLVGRFRGEPVPATGFSIGVSRLLAALQMIDSPIVRQSGTSGPVVVSVMDRDRLADYQAMVQELRAAGIASELYLGGGGMKPQFKYADKRGAPCVVIQGSDEFARGKVQIKDLVEGARAAAAIATNAQWKAQRPAQREVDRADIVATVREILAGE